ncbi:MAG: sporulation protein YqfD [Ruminococcus sp.]|jgi:similar to stage IV sporulation protein|nr:sporulation protein YqfD [Ruminococcus sp.]
MLDNIRGVCKFRVFCESPEAFINRLKMSRVSAKGLQVKEGVLYGEIYGFDLKALERITKSETAQIEILSEYGFIFTLKKYRLRFGLAAGVIIASVLIFYLSNIALKINVYGNTTLSDEQIISIINDYGITIGTYLPNVSLRSAEFDIISGVKEIAWIGLRRSGCIVEAEVSEMTVPPEIVDTNLPCNVVSTQNAQIVKINAVPIGMLVPMLYDTVKKGDLLVSGVITGKLTNSYLVHAMADITGRYEEKKVFTQNLIDAAIDYDSPQRRQKFYLFGLEIPLYLPREQTGDFEYEAELSRFNFFGLQLPAGIINEKITPYKPSQVSYSLAEAKKLLYEKISDYEENFFKDEGVTILERRENFIISKNAVTIETTYVLESNICKTEYIFGENDK